MSPEAEITESVLQAVRDNASVPDSITVEVHNDWVTLRGEADWRYESKEIERAVRSIPAVKGVTNEVRVLSRPLISRAHGGRGPRPLP